LRQHLLASPNGLMKLLQSLVLNIAEGNGRYAELDQAKFLDIAESAAVKLAAFLDLCVKKSAMTTKDCVLGKALLGRIEAMLQAM